MAFTDATNTGIEFDAGALAVISTYSERDTNRQLFTVNAWKESWYEGVEHNDTYLYVTKSIYEVGSPIASDTNFPTNQIWPAGIPT